MEIEIDPLSSVPIYQQIRDRIVEAIAVGGLARGDALTSTRSLAGAFGINPATVAKAYDLLRAEGLVGTNAKSGTFVARDPRSATPSAEFRRDFTARLYTLIAEAIAQGAPADEVLEDAQTVLAELSEGGRSGR